jgi:hypothetical protein
MPTDITLRTVQDRLMGLMMREDPRGPSRRRRHAVFWGVRAGGIWTAREYV